MTCLLAALLAAAQPAAATNAAPATVQSLRIRSATSDIDRGAGVVLLEGDVDVAHSDGYGMRADKVYLFLTASNELSRIVASGNVVLTNATRSATSPLATYRRDLREFEMFGDGDGAYARLVEEGEQRRELEGRRIRFWLDTEQVEVDEPRITVSKTGKEPGK